MRGRAHQLLLLLGLAALTLNQCVGAQGQDYTTMGPYTYTQLTETISIMPVGNTSSVTLDMIVTYPTNGTGPFPLVFMFNGFQARGPWYGGIVKHVASWGYVVVQYTQTGLVPIVTDRVELGYLSPIKSWVAAQAAPGGPLQGLPDMTHIATVGHSRGGKLAALHYATRSDIFTAVLLDPIDNTAFTPEGPDYPSAAKALAAVNRTAGLVGSGINGSCNPTGQNYPKFFASLALGSWQMVILQAGHMQFCSTGNPLLDWGFDLLCGKGNISSQDVISDAGTFAVAWLESQFRPQQAAQGGLADFEEWVQSEVDSDVISFVTKAPTAASGSGGALADASSAQAAVLLS